MKLERLSAKDIERGFSYIDDLVDAAVWKINTMIEEVVDDAACSESNKC